MTDEKNNFKVETPTKRLNAIFSLDCFKYNDMKGLFEDIFGYLSKFGIKIGDLDEKFKGIPDFTKLSK